MTSRQHPDATGANSCKYDDLGRIRFSQDARQRAAGTGASGKVTYTVYDGTGRLSRVWDARGADLARYTHTAAGNIAAHVVGDGIVTGAYAYNPREWVTGIDYPGKFTITQRYDAVGNVTGQDYHRAAS